jgi:tetratricopeptide (TPR) repeat protein
VQLVDWRVWHATSGEFVVSNRLRSPSFLFAAVIFCACVAAWFFLRNSPFTGGHKKDAAQLATERDWTGLVRYATAETDKDAGNAAMWFYRGYALYNLGRYAQAQSAFEKVVQISPAFPDAYVSLGVIAASHRNYKLAVDRYFSALRYRPGYALAQENLAIAYYFDGRHDKAWDTWRELEKSDPGRAGEIQRRFFFTAARPGTKREALAVVPQTERHDSAQ